ncbi:hypothetical protein FA13DRAFT_1730278 [Coprinellus micaceus]|uniref:Uncharacterized protein n=1 Tax=Coprinellus micaceus TaxID=71717 RepID=A0A4Y7TII0_COPMI|nr:hypothetical protein FA13DRAFT_1730278 [Coprinellus micaceus]
MSRTSSSRPRVSVARGTTQAGPTFSRLAARGVAHALGARSWPSWVQVSHGFPQHSGGGSSTGQRQKPGNT